MKLEQYDLTADEHFTTFKFVSEGPKGKVVKLIRFEFVPKGYYNLAFGDKLSPAGDLDDKAITNNGDRDKVLATIVAALYLFCSRFPEAWVYATGSTFVRTRLYRMGISKYYDIATEDFLLLGETDDTLEPFEKGKDYLGFLVQRKSA